MANSIYIASVEGSSSKSTIALGILDALVFTGGIGENSAEARLLCVEGLGFMGIEIDEYVNGRWALSARTISPTGGRIAVMVVPTNEELEIAITALRVLFKVSDELKP